jgi:UDP-N-acetylmuramoyl-L-alanyl-D-glutamate--2,6-diaminopimelate ligase
MWQDIKNIYHLFQAIAANLIYRFPSKDMTIIGVTGTDGKTTTSSLIYRILHTAGLPTALISTVSAIINGKAYDTGFHVTTPNSLCLQSYIRKAKKEGVKFLVIETTSHGLHQNRLFGIPFKIAVLTNISNEHLDYHKTYEKYVAAKAKLFQSAKTAILNRDDKSLSYIFPYLKNKKIITYGLKKNSNINPANSWFKTKLIGEFNLYNTLAAVAVARELSIKETVIAKACSSFTPPIGRTEIVYDKGFLVMIDFAHTPGSFQHLLPEINKLKKGRLIHIFGSAGNRDKYKRPEMGKISSKFADIMILTAEDPRNENVEKIISEIEKGIDRKFNKKNLLKISDRKKAIFKAIELAQTGDIVLLTGKGHEPSMNLGQGEVPWSEHQAVKEALAGLSFPSRRESSSIKT